MAGVICASGDLCDGGKGARFTVLRNGEQMAAFAVRYRGVVHAYLNRCAHRGIELDWNPGEFFNADRRFLVCAAHGACYEPDSGGCAVGQCRGATLAKLPVIERDGAVLLEETDTLHLADRK